MTSPLMRLVSVSDLCCISISSTMWRSMGVSLTWIAWTASTMMSVICLAMSGWILVLRLVLAMLVRMDCFSSSVIGIFIESRISRAFTLALSKPSVIILGWRPSEM